MYNYCTVHTEIWKVYDGVRFWIDLAFVVWPIYGLWFSSAITIFAFRHRHGCRCRCCYLFAFNLIQNGINLTKPNIKGTFHSCGLHTAPCVFVLISIQHIFFVAFQQGFSFLAIQLDLCPQNDFFSIRVTK